MGYLSSKVEESCSFCHWNYLKKKLKKDHPNRPSELTEFSYSQLHAATNGFSKHNLLGQGSHGFVYKAQLLNGRKSCVAAVKMNKQTEINAAAAAPPPAENELRILARVYHPRLVNLLGYGLDSAENILTVVEFMPNGSLYELLHCSTRPPGLDRRVRFALQIARAVRFCHSLDPPVIHRDIKSSNALIDEKLHARLGDFGLALMGRAAAELTPPAGTLGYLDPGYLAPGDVSTTCDVFSFGILLLEIITGRNAIDVNYSPPAVMDWAVPLINSGNHAEIFDRRIGTPEDCSFLRQLAEVAARCVTKTAAERPTMAEVVRCLKAVYKRVSMPPIRFNIRWRVNCMREWSRVDKHELLEDSKEMVKISMVGSRRTRKVSNVSTVELDRNIYMIG